MEIDFSHRKQQSYYESSKELVKKYGPKQASKIIQRINELQSAESLAEIKKLPQTNLHSLHSNFEGCFAVNLLHPYRMILLPIGECNLSDLSTIKKVRIMEIYYDYH